jgi:hypothetical protein
MHAGVVDPFVLDIPEGARGVNANRVLEISEDTWHGTEDICDETS